MSFILHLAHTSCQKRRQFFFQRQAGDCVAERTSVVPLALLCQLESKIFKECSTTSLFLSLTVVPACFPVSFVRAHELNRPAGTTTFVGTTTYLFFYKLNKCSACKEFFERSSSFVVEGSDVTYFRPFCVHALVTIH